MKKHHALATLTVVIFFGFASCRKWDWDWFDKSKTDCDVQSYYLTEINHGGPDPFLFEKKYNAARDRVTEITFTFLNLHPVEVPYQARLVYETDRFFAINKLNKKDTLMKVLLNSQGRVKKVYGKIHRDSIIFEYDHKQRLKVIAAEISAGGGLFPGTLVTTTTMETYWALPIEICTGALVIFTNTIIREKPNVSFILMNPYNTMSSPCCNTWVIFRNWSQNMCAYFHESGWRPGLDSMRGI